MKLGAHLPIAGGLENAPKLAHEHQMTAFQIFSKNQRQWLAKPLMDTEIESFHTEIKNASFPDVIVHSAYLINLCSTNPQIQKQSLNAFIDELERCELLDIKYFVFHPGSHLGSGEDKGLKKVAESVQTAIKKLRTDKVQIMIEITAGQGTNLGYKFEHIRKLIDMIDSPLIGVCFDTCHAFASGYDITTKEYYEKTMALFDNVIGLKYLKAFHLNDSKGNIRSRLDRHEHIGKGFLKLEPFKLLINDSRFTNHPGVIETPGGITMDVQNLSTLYKLKGER